MKLTLTIGDAAIWIYKNNAKDLPYQRAFGNWDKFFLNAKVKPWGRTTWVPKLIQARPGDLIIASQSDRPGKKLVGLAQVVEHRLHTDYTELILKPLVMLPGLVCRALKKRDPKVRRIPALQGGMIKSLYSISLTDTRRLLRYANVNLEK